MRGPNGASRNQRSIPNVPGSLGGKKDSPVRILLIGPLPPPVGGATRLFSYLAEDLTNHPACRCTVVDISRPPGRNRISWNLMKALEVLWKTVLSGPRVDVISFHTKERGHVYFDPVIYLVSRVFRKLFAHGLPVIVTGLHSTREIIDESCRILIPPRAPEAPLALAMGHFREVRDVL